MASPLEQLDAEEAVVRRRLAGLRAQMATLAEQVAGLEKRLDHVAIARDLFQTMTADGEEQARSDASAAGRDAAPTEPQPGTLAGADERVVVAMASAGRPMRAKEVAQALGEPQVRGRVETTRARLKKLVAAGWLTQAEPGLFAIAAGVNGHAVKGAAEADEG